MNLEIQAKIKNAGIRPSVQRVAIYEYLYTNNNHPDVDTVYTALSPLYSTLSKTTVYNTLKLFEANKLVRSLNIEDDKLRFDAQMEQHIHFKCNGCGLIMDVHARDYVQTPDQFCEAILPSGFHMESIQTTIWGVCKKCSGEKESHLLKFVRK